MVLFKSCRNVFAVFVFRNWRIYLIWVLIDDLVFVNSIFSIFISTLTSTFLKDFWHFVVLNNVTIFNVVIHFVQVLRDFLVASVWAAATTIVNIVDESTFGLWYQILSWIWQIIIIIKALILILKHDNRTRIDWFSLSIISTIPTV